MNIDLIPSLQTHFGFTDFRDGQLEAVQSLMSGQHTLVVMPTGSGKSLIYQLAALHLPGVTLVISPLIALMKDQVDSLERRGVAATFVNSALGPREINNRLARMIAGEYRIVYIAPERLRSIQFQRTMERQMVSLLVVDEAHCISEWGHDFRPDYLHIAQFRVELGNPLTAALTATATPQVQNDIARLLGLSPIHHLVTGFNRPNLYLEVRYTADQTSRLRELRELLKDQQDGAAIVYTGTRREAEDVAEFISSVVRVKAQYYHAGLQSEERTRIQNAFMDGDLSVVVATNAFGMGIDRPDVREVIHYSMPGSLEAYYQEAGRAGRDGLPARAVLLYSPEDRALQEWFIETSEITLEDLRLLFNALRPDKDKSETSITNSELSILTGLQEVKVRLGLSELERAGAVEHRGDEGTSMRIRPLNWNETEIQANLQRFREHQTHRKALLAQMIHYAESNSCRRKIILDYFGDRGSAEVDVCCDNCEAHQSASTIPTEQTELTQSAREALVVLDTVRRLPNAVGSEKIAQILKGSKAKDIVQFGYDRHTYYGRLAVLSLTEIKHMIDQLLEMRYFKKVGGEYPVLQLTPQGEAAIRNKTIINLRKKRSITPELGSQKKAKRQAGGTLEITAQLISEGLSVEQIAAQRELSPLTIYGHAAKLIAAGRLRVEAVVTENVRHLIENAIRQAGSAEPLFPIKMLLPDEIEYNVIRCVVEGWKLGQTINPESEKNFASQKKSNPTAGSSKLDIQHVVGLGNAGLSSDVPELISYLHNPDGNIRRLAASALGKIRDKQATLPLLQLLVREDKPQVRQYVVKALGSIGDIRAKSTLEEIAIGEYEKDYTRKAAKAALLMVDSGTMVGTETRTIPKQQHEPASEDVITAFLSRPHPRQLIGPWDEGWALSFHSQFYGANWGRSGTGELAYRLKYQADLSVIPILVEQAHGLIDAHPALGRVDMVVPVPPSIPRPHEPVSSFANALAKQLELPCSPILTKTRQTRPQKELHTAAQKRANVAGAFSLESSIKNKSVMVIDDLFDSGATLEEIYHLLHRSGASRVCVLTLTRSIHSDA